MNALLLGDRILPRDDLDSYLVSGCEICMPSSLVADCCFAGNHIALYAGSGATSSVRDATENSSWQWETIIIGTRCCILPPVHVFTS
jgi:hypothetical protein